MKKTFKWLAAILAIGTVAGIIIAYLRKGDKDKEDDFRFDCDEEDFDLDSDLQPVSERGYVSLTPGGTESEADTEAQEGTAEPDADISATSETPEVTSASQEKEVSEN